MTTFDRDKAEKRFNTLYEKLYFTADGLTRAEQLEYLHITDMLASDDRRHAFDDVIRAGDYRTA